MFGVEASMEKSSQTLVIVEFFFILEVIYPTIYVCRSSCFGVDP